MSTTASVPSPWSAVDFVVDFYTRDKKLGSLSEMLAWIATVALFRKTEAQTHYLAEPTKEDRCQHKLLLAALVAGGERVLAHINMRGELSQNLDGVSTADVEAMIEELRMTHLQWYGDMTKERREQILQD